MYNTDRVSIWTIWSYWHSDTARDARDIQVTETHGFTQRLTNLASVLHLAQVILGTGGLTGKMCFSICLDNSE